MMSRCDYYRTMPDELHLRGTDWEVRPIELAADRRFIERHHYSDRTSSTAVAVHGLFQHGCGKLMGVAC
jgi:hypothetical protein